MCNLQKRYILSKNYRFWAKWNYRSKITQDIQIWQEIRKVVGLKRSNQMSVENAENSELATPSAVVLENCPKSHHLAGWFFGSSRQSRIIKVCSTRLRKCSEWAKRPRLEQEAPSHWTSTRMACQDGCPQVYSTSRRVKLSTQLMRAWRQSPMRSWTFALMR